MTKASDFLNCGVCGKFYSKRIVQGNTQRMRNPQECCGFEIDLTGNTALAEKETPESIEENEIIKMKLKLGLLKKTITISEKLNEESKSSETAMKTEEVGDSLPVSEAKKTKLSDSTKHESSSSGSTDDENQEPKRTISLTDS